MHDVVRTRFAPSPTGRMHVGNLRTALYEYLIARSLGGSFVLRIEDTDQERQVESAIDIIYDTLRAVGLKHDEGPDIGGPYGPYIQSERLPLYRQYADQLLESGQAYRCFCTRERLESLKEDANKHFTAYDRHCRHLDQQTVQNLLDSKKPYVIRQKMPIDGSTTFDDAVYGSITVDNRELEDQILIKSDGYPTYNYANVIDDHLMNITHVVRGSEYLSSTPKYNLLYEAFGWEVPTYVHLPLILGKDGQKLSKRHGSTSFADLVQEGYLPEAIVNAIALLGWCPKENRELFTLDELCQFFSIDRISKSPSIFDFDKLDWFNASYLRSMESTSFLALISPILDEVFDGAAPLKPLLAELLQPRVVRLTDIPHMIHFLRNRQSADLSLYDHKKAKSSWLLAGEILPELKEHLSGLTEWTRESIHDCLTRFAEDRALKTGQVMWPLRISLSGQAVTPGGAVEIALLLGQQEVLARLSEDIEHLSQNVTEEDMP